MDSEADEEAQEEITVDEAVTVDVVVEDVAAAEDEVNKQITKFTTIPCASKAILP